MRRYSKTKGIKRIFNDYSVILIAALLLMLAVFISRSLRPVIMIMAKQYGTVSVAQAVNDAVSDIFTNEEITYSDMVRLSYNSMGFVTSCEYDSAMLNRIKIGLNHELIQRLDRLRASKISLPLGSISGDVNLSGHGPFIRLKIAQSSVPEIEIVSHFESVGINTVKHDILLRITVNSQIYLPPHSEEFSFTQDFVIAQTIIVGSIPSGYASIG